MEILQSGNILNGSRMVTDILFMKVNGKNCKSIYKGLINGFHWRKYNVYSNDMERSL